MTGRPRLSDAQRRTLLRLSPTLWRGTREGVGEGSTIAALERKGLATAAWTPRPYRRVVGRLTRAGVELARELDLDLMEQSLRGPDGWATVRAERLVALWIAGRITQADLDAELARRARAAELEHRRAVLEVLVLDLVESAGAAGLTDDELRDLVAGADYELRDGELPAALERHYTANRIANRDGRIAAAIYPSTQETPQA